MRGHRGEAERSWQRDAGQDAISGATRGEGEAAATIQLSTNAEIK